MPVTSGTPPLDTPRLDLETRPGCTTEQQRQLPPDQHVFHYQDGNVRLSLCDGQVCYRPTDSVTQVSLDPNSPSHGLFALGAALTRALALQGGVVLHAAVFTLAGITVAAIGPSGSGKSTLATAALLAGAQVLSDDMALVGLTDSGTIAMRALRGHLSLRETTLSMLPAQLKTQLRVVEYAGETRWELDPAKRETNAPQILSPDALLLLQPRSAAGTQLTEASTAVALATLISAASPRYLAPPHSQERARSLATLQALANKTRNVQIRVSGELLAAPEREVVALVSELKERFF